VEELSNRLNVRTFMVTLDERVPKENNSQNFSSSVETSPRKTSGIPLLGILTNRDIRAAKPDDSVKSAMTPINKLVVWKMAHPVDYCTKKQAY
jgi:hypothetical protein